MPATIRARLGLGKALFFLEEYEEPLQPWKAQVRHLRSTTMLHYLALSYEAQGLRSGPACSSPL